MSNRATFFDLILDHLQANLKSKHVALLDRQALLSNKDTRVTVILIVLIMSQAPNGMSRVKKTFTPIATHILLLTTDAATA